jgi:alpha-amylase
MGVIMQAFYWDCPRLENREFQWWSHVKDKVPSLHRAGFTALWLPPAIKGANLGGQSMGYDPYDYYDLGEFDQKGSTRTWFGSKQELLDLIGATHERGMQIYADVVFNHNSGADGRELNPFDTTERWTVWFQSASFPTISVTLALESWDGGTLQAC